ncbi:MAG: glycosyltransferase family 4 protein [Proteobacteria bacterium]|nr:glycosyltransferase family 4 protein [Pseudomonadota bacterium]
MKCLLVSDGVLFKSKDQKNKWYTKNTFVEFVKQISTHFSVLTLFAPVKNKRRNLCTKGYFEVNSGASFTISPGGSFSGVTEFYCKAPFIYWKNSKKIRQLIHEHDVVVLRLPSMNAFFFCKDIIKSQKPYVNYIVGDQEAIITYAGKYKGFIKPFAKTLALIHNKRTQCLVTNSSASLFLGDDLFKKFGSNCSNPYQIFTSLVRKHDIIQKKISKWPPLTVKLLFAGRLEHEKGVETLLKALSILISQSNYLFTLDICGTGSAEKQIKKCAENLGLSAYVNFQGFVKLHPDLDELFLTSDIFILPSISEGIPKVLLEAMAKGIPIIATSVGGIPEIITHKNNGLLVKPEDETSIAKCILALLDDFELMNTIISNGYNFVKEKTIEHQAEKLSEIIKSQIR